MTLERSAAALRVEVRRAKSQLSVVVVDPQTEQQCDLVTGIDAEHIRRVNKFLWHQFSSTVAKLKGDPNISDGGRLAFEIYRIGQAALIELCGEDHAERLPELKEFCAQRLRARSQPSDPDQADVPTIEIAASRADHVPFEVMPLFGGMQPDLGGSEQLERLGSVMPGLAAVCVHGAASAPVETESVRRISIRIFRYDGLEGAILDERYLKELTRENRSFRVVSIYPPKGYKPPPDFPELELVREVAQRQRATKDGRQQIPIAHFTCHVAQTKDQVLLRLRPNGVLPKEVAYKLHEITVASEYVEKPPPYSPLIFLSACRSGKIDEFTFTSAARALGQLHPLALVGALADLPSVMSAEFAKTFYGELRDAKPVGAALRSARMRLLAAPFTNPLGLLFVTYYGESLRFSLGSKARDYIPPDTYTTL